MSRFVERWGVIVGVLVLAAVLVGLFFIVGCEWPFSMGSGTSTGTFGQKEKLVMREERTPPPSNPPLCDNTVRELAKQFYGKRELEYEKATNSSAVATTAPVAGGNIKNIDTSAPETNVGPGGAAGKGGDQQIVNKPGKVLPFSSWALIGAGAVCLIFAGANYWWLEKDNTTAYRSTVRLFVAAGVCGGAALLLEGVAAWLVVAGAGVLIAYEVWDHFDKIAAILATVGVPKP